MRRARSTAGVTLIEMLIAVTLLSLLMLAMLMVLRVGLMAYSKTGDKLMENRRVTGAQRVLQDELTGLMPVTPPCLGAPGLSQLHFNFLQAEARTMRLVSTYSLHGGWRGRPQMLEFLVIAGKNGLGVRLVVNEIPYTPMTAGRTCVGVGPNPDTGVTSPVFAPAEAGPNSFILADQLAFCRFSYYTGSGQPNDPIAWRPAATGRGWPYGIRIEMAPLEPDPSRLQPITVTAPLLLHRSIEVQYEDK
jgi:prepilin-type N-terminal cleavage/methylation domain-containing protein